ncbi:MAG: hypothetical protein RL669_908, partial [Pseudomonadota bacterium]
ETQPLYDAVSQVIYSAGREAVSHVWVAGQPVVEKRHLQVSLADTTESDINRLARAWQNRAQQFLEGSAS